MYNVLSLTYGFGALEMHLLLCTHSLLQAPVTTKQWLMSKLRMFLFSVVTEVFASKEITPKAFASKVLVSTACHQNHRTTLPNLQMEMFTYFLFLCHLTSLLRVPFNSSTFYKLH